MRTSTESWWKIDCSVRHDGWNQQMPGFYVRACDQQDATVRGKKIKRDHWKIDAVYEVDNDGLLGNV